MLGVRTLGLWPQPLPCARSRPLWPDLHFPRPGQWQWVLGSFQPLAHSRLWVAPKESHPLWAGSASLSVRAMWAATGRAQPRWAWERDSSQRPCRMPGAGAKNVWEPETDLAGSSSRHRVRETADKTAPAGPVVPGPGPAGVDSGQREYPRLHPGSLRPDIKRKSMPGLTTPALALDTSHCCTSHHWAAMDTLRQPEHQAQPCAEVRHGFRTKADPARCLYHPTSNQGRLGCTCPGPSFWSFPSVSVLWSLGQCQSQFLSQPQPQPLSKAGPVQWVQALPLPTRTHPF